MPRAIHLVVPLANRPGALAHLCTTLGEAGVNITAILAPEARGRGQVRVMVDDTDLARDALKGAKFRFSEEDVVVIEVDNRPGAFGEIAGKLAQSRINIKYAYVTTSPYGRAKVVAAFTDVAKALGALGERDSKNIRVTLP